MIPKSNHASIRQQQRGIPNSVVDVVLNFGEPTNRPGGAMAYFITNAEASRHIGTLKRLIALIERAKNKVVIQSDSDTTLTVYHKQQG